MSLTNNAISELRNLTVMGNPLTVQVISLKSVTNNGSSSTRYRVIVSDGAHFMQGMLATQMNHLAENGTLQENSIIVIHDAISNDVAGKKIAIILGMDVTENPGVKIGNPVDIEGAPAAQAGGSGGPQPLSSAGNHSSGSFVNPYANGGGNSMSKAGGAVARPRVGGGGGMLASCLSPLSTRTTIDGKSRPGSSRREMSKLGTMIVEGEKMIWERKYKKLRRFRKPFKYTRTNHI